jgi:hypothetical protein
MKKEQPKTKRQKYCYYRTSKTGAKVPKPATFTYNTGSVKDYNNHLHIYVKLSSSAQYLLRYLVENMDVEDNLVINHPAERQKFLKFMSRSINTSYKDATIRKAFTELKRIGYLIDLKHAKRLVVNPKYFFKGTEKQREIFFKSLLYQACEPGNKNLDIVVKLSITYF